MDRPIGHRLRVSVWKLWLTGAFPFRYAPTEPFIEMNPITRDPRSDREFFGTFISRQTK